MTHNPILRQETLAWHQRTTVERDTVAVLYQNHRFARTAEAGERVGNAQVFVVDVAAHSYEWRVQLPAKDQGDFFAFTIALRYKVEDAERMVRERVADTEKLLEDTLKPTLRPVTRRFQLRQQQDAAEAVEEELGAAPLAALCGLRFTAAACVTPDISRDAQKRIDEQNHLEDVLSLPQVAHHAEDLPSKELAHPFRVKANVHYRVVDRSELPKISIAGVEAAERELWEKIQNELRTATPEHYVDQIAQAEAAMQKLITNCVRDPKIEVFGLRALSVTVKAELDEAAMKHYVELAETRYKQAKEEAERAGVKANVSYFLELAKEQGSLGPLWIAVSRGEISLRDISAAMKSDDQTRFERLFGMMDRFREAGGNDESTNWEAYQELVREVTRSVVKSPLVALPGGDTAQLPPPPVDDLPEPPLPGDDQ